MIEVPFFIPLVGFAVVLLLIILIFNINKKIEIIFNLLKGKKFTYEVEDNKKEKIKNNSKNYITAPMVGTVYLRPDPNKPPYINIGDHIKQGDTIVIIEAMKTFNEVRSTTTGVVKEILIEDNSPVEFGQNLIIIE